MTPEAARARLLFTGLFLGALALLVGSSQATTEFLRDATWIAWKSEYGTAEMLSRVLAFATAGAGLLSSRSGVRPDLGLLFFFLGLVLYGAETDLMADAAQPVFGGCVGGLLAWRLLRLGSAAAIGVVAGGACMAAAVLMDRQVLPRIFLGEEGLEAIGVGLVAAAAGWVLADPLATLPRRAILGALAGLLLAVPGASFLHWQYPDVHFRHRPLPLLALAAATAAVSWCGSRIPLARPLPPAVGRTMLAMLVLPVLPHYRFHHLHPVANGLLWLLLLGWLGRHLREEPPGACPEKAPG